MRKFKFKLDGLLRIKLGAEKEIKAELMDIQGACAKKEQEIVDTDNKVSEWSQYYNQVMLETGSSHNLAIIDGHLKSLYKFKDQLKIGLEILNKKKDDLILQYQTVKRDVKVLEHLREKKYEEYRTGILKEEEKESDEMATLRYIREKEQVW